MPADGIDLGGHWGPLGELVRSRAAGFTHVELDPLIYEYWHQLLPNADSVDDEVNEMTDALFDHYEVWAYVGWRPDDINGGSPAGFGVLTLGSHCFVAEPPAYDAGIGWLLHGEVDQPKETVVWNWLVDLFRPEIPIPDFVDTPLPQADLRQILRSALDRSEPVDSFGWKELGEKVGMDPSDRDRLLDRYIEGATAP